MPTETLATNFPIFDLHDMVDTQQRFFFKVNTKPPKGVFFFAHKSTVEISKNDLMDSVRGLETSLEVFPDTPASFTNPVHTQKLVFGIPDHVPYCDLVRGLCPKKKTPFRSLKKTLLYCY